MGGMLMLRALRLVRRAVGPPGAAACRRYHRPPALPALVPAATRAESPSSPPALQRQERANTPTRARAGARSWQPASPKRQRALDINELIMGAQTPARVLAVISSARAEFNNVNLATALHRIAKLTSAQPGADRKAFFHEHEAQVRELLAEIRAELPSFAGRQLAACAYASSLICNGLAQPLLSDVRSLLVAVGPIAAPQVATLHSQGLANLAWAHAQADVPSTDVFDALTPVALARLSEFTIEGLSALAWSYAKLQLHEPELAGAIGREVVARFMSRDSGDAGSANADAAAGAPNAHAATHIRPRELTNLAWSFGRLRVPERGALFDALADIAVEQIGAFNTRDLSQLVWSYAKAGHAAPLLFDEIARVAPARLSHFNSQDFANMTCAYASAGMCADELFRAVALEVEPRLDEFTAQGLANLAWAFAKAGAPSARVLLESIAAVFPPRLPDLGPRQLAMLVWAFSKNGASSEAPFRAVEHELGSRKLADFNHVELVNTAWAFATARVSAPALFTRIGAEVAVRAPEFGAQTLANAAWSLARSRAPARRAFSAICAEVEGRPLDIFSAQQLANLIWAFSIAGCDAHRLLSAVAPEVTRRAAEFKPVELANLAWAMAVSSSFSSGAIELPLRKALVLALVERIDALEHETDCELGGAESLSQIHQANMALLLEGAELGVSFSTRMGERCAEAMRSLAVSTAEPSARHRRLSAALTRLGHAHDTEYMLPPLSYRVDIALVGRPVVIELHGPASFDTQKQLLASAAMMVRHMRLAGWSVIELPFWEWPDSPDEQYAYLSARMRELPAQGVEPRHAAPLDAAPGERRGEAPGVHAAQGVDVGDLFAEHPLGGAEHDTAAATAIRRSAGLRR